MASPGLNPLKRNMSQIDLQRNEMSATTHFNIETLLHLLYGKKANEPIDIEKLGQSKTYCDICRIDRPPNGCSFHELSPNADQKGTSYAMTSFPPEVQLCTSSIPGARYGVCAKRVIPEGTWIGPYEGVRLKPEELSKNPDNSYIWEIYENGQATGYIDGSDESTSSWMRFIRCARSKTEQNMYAFQYLDNVFYRSFKEIRPGTEMLVWYDEKYSQHMGIPMALQEIEFVNANDIEQNIRSSTWGQRRDGQNTQKQVSISQRNIENQVFPAIQQTPLSSHASISRQEITSTPCVTTVTTAPPESYYQQQRVISVSARGYQKTEIPAAPVNISAGHPPQSITGRLSARVHPGITGTHNPLVQEQTLDRGTVHFGRKSIPYGYDNDNMTSSSMPTNSGPVDPKPYPTVHSRPSSQPHDQFNETSKVSGLSLNVKVVSSDHSEVRTSREERRRGGRLSYLPYHEVTEEDLRQRGYLVKGDSQRPKLARRRQIPPKMGVYVLGDGEDILDQKVELGETFEDIKANESDSNSSSSRKDVGSAIDEISMWRCRQCQKTFTQRVQLQIHVCPNEPFKPYRCGQCEMSFHTAIELRSHVDTHASEKPFKCGFCSRSFAGATTLNNHIRTHMGRRPFNCDCGKSFAQAGQLARHQRTPEECEYISSKNNS